MIAASVEIPTWLPILVAILGGGGIATAIAVLIKARPQAAQITVQAAEVVVEMQTGVINALRAEMTESATRERTLTADLRKAEGQIAILERDLSTARAQLEAAHAALAGRMDVVEGQINGNGEINGKEHDERT